MDYEEIFDAQELSENGPNVLCTNSFSPIIRERGCLEADVEERKEEFKCSPQFRVRD